MKIYDVIILGAGASGLMCASQISKKLSVGIVDINAKVAQKLRVSGGGKCNITNVNVSKDNFDGDADLVSSVLKRFSKDNLLDFLQENSLTPVIRKNRYYFCKDSSDEIINILKRLTKHQELILNIDISAVTKNADIFDVQTSKGIIKAKRIIVATGGKSFKTLGASD
ncbi:MAG: NAD(P)/FAD-dependent oxidoreductase, partial [Sulfurimonas sp.]|nr:NAD(P)/FAD-dependent oxidoreductase [Sulfurimonas sp.]